MTNSNTPKPAPREWWIRGDGQTFGRSVHDTKPEIMWGTPLAHVIEKSAYDEVVAERDELRNQVDTLSYHGPSDYAKVKAERDELRSVSAGLKNTLAHLEEQEDRWRKWRDERLAETEKLKSGWQQTEDNLQDAWRERDAALALLREAVAALKHADRYIEYAMEFNDVSKNTCGIEIVAETLTRIDESGVLGD